MNRDQMQIAEDLEDLRLQLLITKALGDTQLKIDEDTIWQTLEYEGRILNRDLWRKRTPPKPRPLFQQALGYFGILDAIAGILYGDEPLGNRERFTRLIRDFLRWEYSSHVSIPHLYQLLRVFPLPELEAVRAKVFETHDSARATFTIDMDVPGRTVGTWFGGDVAGKLKPTGLTLDDLTHAVLLYRYRSRVVHEMSGYGIGAEARSLQPGTKPSYHGISFNGDQHFQLTYPLGMIAWMAEEALARLPAHLTTWRVGVRRASKYDAYYYPRLNVGVGRL